ncbi:hypothetical protein J2S74_000164 [Evansella vedderi]|uniref:Uncharacterized protein n=1 Tax=Evansella vedderi TaxID=38282 RepID=A0ABT9ZPZ6_9BACI|nr:hypothetical protein [Evansella vedderi]
MFEKKFKITDAAGIYANQQLSSLIQQVNSVPKLY